MLEFSDDWLTAVCPHGIIYGAKFPLRSESPRDYVDLLRGLKHIPNIFINDMAHVVAAHANRYQPDFFTPHEGRAGEANAENVASAQNNSFQFSFPWLHNFCQSS